MNEQRTQVFMPRLSPPYPGHSTDQEHRHHEKLPGPQVAAQLSRLILSTLSCDNGDHHVRRTSPRAPPAPPADPNGHYYPRAEHGERSHHIHNHHQWWGVRCVHCCGNGYNYRCHREFFHAHPAQNYGEQYGEHHVVAQFVSGFKDGIGGDAAVFVTAEPNSSVAVAGTARP